MGRYVWWGACAGVLAPIVLLAVLLSVTALEWTFLRTLGWSVVQQNEVGWPSILALTDIGWVVTAALVVAGLLGLAFAASLYVVMPSWPARVAALLLGVASGALLLVAFKSDYPGVAERSWHGEIHARAYPAIPLSCIAAAALLAWSLWHEAGWRNQARVSLAAFPLLGSAFVASGIDAYGQLARYVLFGGLMLWLEVLALGLVGSLRDTDP